MRAFFLFALLGACGEKAVPTGPEDADGDGVTAETDCDDDNPDISPDAVESCDELDNNCNGSIDEGVKVEQWIDADGDGFGARGAYVWACTPPAGYSATSDDCDDLDPTQHPGADEACNGVDDDCDGVADNSISTVMYTDADGDGYGDPATAADVCVPRDDQVSNGIDCDDSDPSANPAAEETCGDGDDHDCDGYIDIAAAETIWYSDEDGDGYGHPSIQETSCDPPPGWVAIGGDCRPDDGISHPGAEDICDGLDNDCDGREDEDFDIDGDGFDAEGCGGTDCDDSDPDVSPVSVEICDDDIDNDCDGRDLFCGYDTAYTTSAADARWTAGGSNYDAGRLIDVGEMDGDPGVEVVVATLYASSYNGGGYIMPTATTGSASMETVGYRINSSYDSYGAGRSVGVGDADGDGYEDVIFGSPWASNPGVRILFSPTTADMNLSAADVTLLGSSGSYFGHGSDLGDINGDGVADAVVGAYYTLGGRGSVYVKYGPLTAGSSSLVTGADAQIDGTLSSGYLGRTLRAGADFNGDGIGDVVVPAVYASATGSGSGTAYLLYGPLSGSTTMSSADVTINGEAGGDYTGFTNSVGDVNGDGVMDAVLGSYSSKSAPSGGSVFVIFGPPSAATMTTGSSDVIIRGTTAGGLLSSGLFSNDIDGDGNYDILAGETGGHGGKGGAYLFFGPLSGTITTADAYSNISGHASGMIGDGAAIGDIDGDSFGDLLIGSTSDGSAGYSGVYIFYPSF